MCENLKPKLDEGATLSIEGFTLTNAKYMYTRAVEMSRGRCGQHCTTIHAIMKVLCK